MGCRRSNRKISLMMSETKFWTGDISAFMNPEAISEDRPMWEAVEKEAVKEAPMELLYKISAFRVLVIGMLSIGELL